MHHTAAADLKDLGITLMDYDRMSLTGDDKLGTVTVDLSAAIDKPHENVEFAELAVQKPGKGTLLVRATFVPGKPQIRGGDNLELGEDDPEHIDETITEAEQVCATSHHLIVSRRISSCTSPISSYLALSVCPPLTRLCAPAPCALPTQERLHGTLRVQLLSASNLLAADKGGTSDPYVKLTTMKGAVHKSAVVKKTLNPVWSEQTFEWTGTKTAMGLLELSVFDRDFGSAADDRLGSATINLAAAGVFDESAGVSSRRDLEATLNTRGTVQLRALWTVTADERIGGVTLDELKSSSEEQFLAECAPHHTARGATWHARPLTLAARATPSIEPLAARHVLQVRRGRWAPLQPGVAQATYAVGENPSCLHPRQRARHDGRRARSHRGGLGRHVRPVREAHLCAGGVPHLDGAQDGQSGLGGDV